MPLLILGVIIIGIGLYLINIYNFFQTAKTRIAASIQEIGNQLKRQANLIPNLSESAKGYLQHEKSIFDELTAARKTVLSGLENPQQLGKASAALEQVMPRLMAMVESNPQLKADGVMMKLMDELRDTSDKIMYARRTLIDLTADYNAKRLTFPSNLIASTFNFPAEPGLEMETTKGVTSVTADEVKNVDVKF